MDPGGCVKAVYLEKKLLSHLWIVGVERELERELHA